MKLLVNKSAGIPLHVQLKEQIKYLILTNSLAPGAKLPSGRYLAENLHVTRNTVLNAYRELEDEGYIIAKHGKGVFVADNICFSGDQQVQAKIVAYLDKALELCFHHNISPEGFTTMAYARVLEKFSAQKHFDGITALFIECNAQRLEDYAKRLNKELGIKVIPVLIKDLAGDRTYAASLIKQGDLIITTFFHLNEIKAILPGREIYAVNVAPHLKTFMRTANLPKTSKLGIICFAAETALKLKETLEAAGAENIIGYATPQDEEKLLDLYKHATHLLVTPGCLDEAKYQPPAGIEIIDYENVLDTASLNLIKSAILKLKKSAKP